METGWTDARLQQMFVWGDCLGTTADGVVAGAVLRGRRFDVDLGDQFTVFGTVRLIRPPGGVVNGVNVPAWTELRIEE